MQTIYSTSEEASFFYQLAIDEIYDVPADITIERLSIAIMFDPTCSDAFVVRGVCNRLDELPFAAINDFDKAISLDPFNIEAYIERGKMKYLFGKSADALLDINKAIELDSDCA